jgi:hypothetical protein
MTVSVPTHSSHVHLECMPIQSYLIPRALAHWQILDVQGLEDVTNPIGIRVIIHEADAPKQLGQRLDNRVQEEDKGLPRHEGYAIHRQGSAFNLHRAVGLYVMLADLVNASAMGKGRDICVGNVGGGGDGRDSKDGTTQQQRVSGRQKEGETLRCRQNYHAQCGGGQSEHHDSDKVEGICVTSATYMYSAVTKVTGNWK